MRAHDHGIEGGRELRPKAARVESEGRDLSYRAAVAGRMDVLGPAGLLGLQRAVGNAAVSALMSQKERSPVLDVVGSGGGSPLDTDTRADMDSRLGHDFGDVRLHTDSRARDSATAVNAHAYTVGSNVVFQRDKYDPSSTESKTMLAPELTHVVQQRSGPVEGTPTEGGVQISDPSDRFEQDAAANAERVMSAPASAAVSLVGSVVQREDALEAAPAWRPEATRSLRSRERGHDLSRVPVHRTGTNEPYVSRVWYPKEESPSAPPRSPVQSPWAPPRNPEESPSNPHECHVLSGPTYTPSGTIPVETLLSGRKKANFRMDATFSPNIRKGRLYPPCCEVRQYVKWDKVYHTGHGGPPNSGFPSSATYGTWYEDRSISGDKRYGHRSGVHSEPMADYAGGAVDEYLRGSARDQGYGDTYRGMDAPQSSVPGSTSNFQLKVIDPCNGDAEKASSDVITVKW